MSGRKSAEKIRTSMVVSAFLLDMMELAASAGRRGLIVAVHDSFTSDLVHFAEFCAAAKPFDFDWRASQNELDYVRDTYWGDRTPPLRAPSSNYSGVIQCHPVHLAYWFRFDSSIIHEAVVRYRMDGGQGLNQALLYLFAFMDMEQQHKDAITGTSRQPASGRDGLDTDSVNQVSTGVFRTLRESGLADLRSKLHRT